MVRAWTLRDRRRDDGPHRGGGSAFAARNRVSAGGRPLPYGSGFHSAHLRPELHLQPRPRPPGRRSAARRARQLFRRPPLREDLILKARLVAAIVVASLLWIPSATQTALAIYCYRGAPPAVYKACLAYNAGIGQQVRNEWQLQNIRRQIHNTQAQMDAIFNLIKTLNAQIAAQQALIAQTQTSINKLDRRIRLADADLTILIAHLSERAQLLNARLRYVDSHGAINYIQLVLTASSFNELMNRMIGAQQVVDSDQKLLDELNSERSLVIQATSELTAQRSQMGYLLKQQKVNVASLQENQTTLAAAVG